METSLKFYFLKYSRMKAKDIPERTPEQRHKDNLPILVKILQDIDNLKCKLDLSIKQKEHIIKDYLSDCDLDQFYKEYEEFKKNNIKRKEFMDKYYLD